MEIDIEVILLCFGVGMLVFSYFGVLVLAFVVDHLYKRVTILEKANTDEIKMVVGMKKFDEVDPLK
jgi:hypothetical protein